MNWIKTALRQFPALQFKATETNGENPMTELKQCAAQDLCVHPQARSGGWLPATEEFFYPQKNGKLRARCKECHKVQHKATRDPQKQLECQRRWIKEHPEKRVEYNQAFNQRHPGRMLKLNRDWYAKNTEEQRERAQKYKQEHHDETLDRHRQYVKEHPEKNRLAYQRRQARKRNLPDDLTMEQWQYALSYFGNCCAVCGRPEGDGYHIAMDHWMPLVNEKCPGTTRFNTIPLCHSITKGAYGACNNSKRSAIPETWLKKRFGEQKTVEILAQVESYFEHLRSLS